MSRALVPIPSTALVAAAVASGMPSYVTVDQAHALIDAASSMRHRLLLKTLWQTGARASEVLQLRPRDLDRLEGALSLPNLKQRSAKRSRKRVYVDPGLVAELAAFARELRLRPADFFFTSQKGSEPLCRQHLHHIVRECSRRAHVEVLGRDGRPRRANPLDFRHGSAVHQIRCLVPVTEVGEQLGHARLDSTMVYTKLANPERRAMSDRVRW